MEVSERSVVREVLLAFDVLPLNAAVLDRDGRIIAVNRCWEAFARENAGSSAATGCGSSYFGVCEAAEPDSCAVAAADGLQRVLTGRAETFELEYPCHSPEKQRWFLMRAAPLLGKDGIPTGAVVSHLDITTRRLAEMALDERARELERSNADLDAFGRIVAHGLKEPLRGMRNYAAFVLEDEGGLREESRGKLTTIVRLAERMHDSLEGLLHYAKVGMSDLALAPVDLGELASEVLELFAHEIEAKNVRASVRGRLPVIRCDRFLVREAMAILVSNAIRYNDKAERVVEIGPVGPGDAGDTGAAGFSVRDNGIGISVSGQKRLFEAFTRLAPRGFGEGTGIGLTIVKRVAERHHGRVLVETRPGEGSTFSVVLGEV